mgnify:CR=1 FL=1
MLVKSKRCAVAKKPARKPLTPKVARVLREAWWLIAVAAALYLTMILASYSLEDPGWSRATGHEGLHNAGGAFGAWFSDLLLYLFGISTYWWVVLALYLIWWGYRRIGEAESEHRHGLGVILSGFGLTLLASSTLESLRFYKLQAELPLAPGGANSAGISGRSCV